MGVNYLGVVKSYDFCHHDSVTEIATDVSDLRVDYFLGLESERESTQS